jgi:hypothetical protein
LKGTAEMLATPGSPEIAGRQATALSTVQHNPAM